MRRPRQRNKREYNKDTDRGNKRERWKEINKDKKEYSEDLEKDSYISSEIKVYNSNLIFNIRENLHVSSVFNFFQNSSYNLNDFLSYKRSRDNYFSTVNKYEDYFKNVGIFDRIKKD